MSSSTEKQGLTPSMISRVAKTFVAMLQRTDPIVQEHVRMQMQDPPKPAPAPEPPAAPAPQDNPMFEALLQQALRPREGFGHTYTPEQLQVLELYLPKHLVTCITELATQHQVDAASIVLGVFESVTLGELTQHALRLRSARDLQAARKCPENGDPS
jgi:hypothetical protein